VINPIWKVWRGRREKVKGVAIVFRASDIGLELLSDLVDEHDRAELCAEICAVLNDGWSKRHLLQKDKNG